MSIIGQLQPLLVEAGNGKGDAQKRHLFLGNPSWAWSGSNDDFVGHSK